MADIEKWQPDVDVVADEDVELIEQDDGLGVTVHPRKLVAELSEGKGLYLRKITIPLSMFRTDEEGGQVIRPVRRVDRGNYLAHKPEVLDPDLAEINDRALGIKTADSEEIVVKPRGYELPVTTAAPGSLLAEWQDSMVEALDRRAGIVRVESTEINQRTGETI